MPAPLDNDDLAFLRSYADGPRIWDASALAPRVFGLAARGLIEPAPEYDDGTPASAFRYRLTEAGRQLLETDRQAPLIAVPAEPFTDSTPLTLDMVRDQARRYMAARYGPDWVYRAPETFPNVIEQWMLAIAFGAAGQSEILMTAIEQHLAVSRD